MKPRMLLVSVSGHWRQWWPLTRYLTSTSAREICRFPVAALQKWLDAQNEHAGPNSPRWTRTSCKFSEKRWPGRSGLHSWLHWRPQCLAWKHSAARRPYRNQLAPYFSIKPNRGGGLNVWLLKAALSLRCAGYGERDIIETLRCFTATDPIKGGEIERAAKRSADLLTSDGIASRPTPKWPAVDGAARARVIAEHDGGAVELWERSPYRFDDDEPQAERIIDELFSRRPADLCCRLPTYRGDRAA